MSIFIFDEDYNGPRFTYGVTIRPACRFNIPDGFIVGSQKDSPDYRFGTVDYPVELSQDDIEHYDMVLVGKSNVPNG